MSNLSPGPRKPTERAWCVNGLTLRGLAWGSPEQAPLLMLHGWLDNAASFSLLAPLLTEYYVVALDLTGHGRSDRRSADASYQIWDDLPEIRGVVEQLGWEHFALLGHSRGAIISTLLASVLPGLLSHLVLLDAFVPRAVSEQEFPRQLQRFLNEKPSLLAAKNRVYPSLEAAVAVRSKGDLTPEAAFLLTQRGVQACEGGVTWTTDRRLHGASAVKLSAGQIQAVVEHISVPTLLLLAQNGRLDDSMGIQDLAGANRAVQVELFPGGHHFHMEENVEKLAARLARFLEKSE
jgi:pimeloyl-ACP methyl ester carboxylesterase